MPENKGIYGKAFVNLIYKAVSEVSGAITTAMITTIVSFLPVFAMEAEDVLPPLHKNILAPHPEVDPYCPLFPDCYSVRYLKAIRRIANYLLVVAGIALMIIYGSLRAGSTGCRVE